MRGRYRGGDFPFGEEEMAYLSQADPLLGGFIAQRGKVERPVFLDPFVCLVFMVVGQLISVVAAEKIWGRLVELVGEIDPLALLEFPPEKLATVGLTGAKARTIYQLALAEKEGSLGMDSFGELGEEQVIKRLTSYRGVGPWTAEMVLIHGYLRPDVISFGDGAIRRGICRLYQLEKLTVERFREISEPLRPYRTVASIYFWEVGR